MSLAAMATIADLKHVEHLSDTVLEEYEEEAETQPGQAATPSASGSDE